MARTKGATKAPKAKALSQRQKALQTKKALAMVVATPNLEVQQQQQTSMGASPSTPVIDQLLHYPEVTFISDTHRKTFVKFAMKSIQSTKFICKDALEKLGVLEQTKAFFNAMGLKKLFETKELTYLSLVLEFLSSLKVTKVEDRENLEFRLANISRRITFKELGEILGLSDESRYLKHYGKYDPEPLWEAISGKKFDDFHACRALLVHHPGIRVWHKVVGNTIIARKDTNHFTRLDFILLESALNVGRIHTKPFNSLRLLVDRWLHVDSGKKGTTVIVNGGLVTVLAKHFDPNFNKDNKYKAKEGGHLIDMPIMINKFKWVAQNPLDTKCGWLTSEARSFTLPSKICRLSVHRTNYLLPLSEEAEYIIQQQKGDHETPSSSIVTPPYPFVYEEFKPEGVEIGKDYVTLLMQAMHKQAYEDRKNAYLAQYPPLLHLARQGLLDPSCPLPSWADKEALFPGASRDVVEDNEVVGNGEEIDDNIEEEAMEGERDGEDDDEQDDEESDKESGNVTTSHEGSGDDDSMMED
ncbi:uncharacterized protein LOC141647719 [Silene latifolia]|uniref:uncharacterized protein LOC141647719 n=1 Tax=Silene latifolia TaxID=37657 RepID=UPI003D772AE0